MKELKSKIDTAEKNISELKYESEEITQHAVQRQKYGKLWLRQ